MQSVKLKEAEAPADAPQPVSIERYDALEAAAVKRTHPYITRQFQSQTFHDLRFQTRISSPEELWKFIDSQQEIRFEDNMVRYLSKRLTKEEFDLFTRLTRKTVEYCKLHGFDPISGRNALSRALIVIRAILTLVPRGATVLEVGPGSGFVAAGLVMLGYKAMCYDVTQSLFLHQSSFWNFLFGDRYQCCMEPGDKVDLSNHDICQIPWWNFIDRDGFELPPIDVLTVNHALNEMPPMSVHFLLHRIKQANDGQPYKAFIEGIGYPTNNNYLEIFQPQFQLLHYNELLIDYRYVPVNVLQSKVEDTSPQPASPSRTKDRIIGYLKNKVGEGKQPWLTLYRLHQRFPHPIRWLRYLGGKFFALINPPPSSVSTGLPRLEALKHENIPFQYTYADIQDFFNDSLPEGNKLNQYEKFAKSMGIAGHM